MNGKEAVFALAYRFGDCEPHVLRGETDRPPRHRGARQGLEIGTGLGCQTAILAGLAAQVFSVEIIEELAREGERRLRAMGCDNVQLRVGDGSRGWAEHAPFDKIIVTAAPKVIPQRLLEQLKVGGRMVLPAGLEGKQSLSVVEKGNDRKLPAS